MDIKHKKTDSQSTFSIGLLESRGIKPLYARCRQLLITLRIYKILRLIIALPFLYLYNRKERKKYEWIRTTITIKELWHML